MQIIKPIVSQSNNNNRRNVKYVREALVALDNGESEKYEIPKNAVKFSAYFSTYYNSKLSIVSNGFNEHDEEVYLIVEGENKENFLFMSLKPEQFVADIYLHEKAKYIYISELYGDQVGRDPEIIIQVEVEE